MFISVSISAACPAYAANIRPSYPGPPASDDPAADRFSPSAAADVSCSWTFRMLFLNFLVVSFMALETGESSGGSASGSAL
jgi:hypothetical protein